MLDPILSCTFHTLSVLHRSNFTGYLSSTTDAMAQESWPTVTGNASSTASCSETTAIHSHPSALEHSLWLKSSPVLDATRHHPLADQGTQLASPGKCTSSGLVARCTCVVCPTLPPRSPGFLSYRHLRYEYHLITYALLNSCHDFVHRCLENLRCRFDTIWQLCIRVQSLMGVNAQVLPAGFINTHLRIRMRQVEFSKRLGSSQCGVQILCCWERILFIIDHLVDRHFVITTNSDLPVRLRHDNYWASQITLFDFDDNTVFLQLVKLCFLSFPKSIWYRA